MEKEIGKLGTDFSNSALLPKWEVLDNADAPVLDAILKEAALAGIFGFAVPESSGGSGLGAAEYAIFVEEVSKTCAGVGTLLAAHLAGIAPLLAAGDGKGAAFLSRVTEAERHGTPAIFVAAIRENTSPEFIPERVDTVVERHGETYTVTGIKTKVLGAGVADSFTVFAKDRNDDAFCWIVVPRGANGVAVQPEAPRLGLKICPMNDVVFKDAHVASENVIARFSGSERLLDLHRFVDAAFAAAAIGVSVATRDVAMKYSTERYQGGKMICDHDAIRMMLADMELSIRAARALAHGSEAGFLGSAYVADAAEKTCLDAIQVLGGYGYMKDFRIERMLRDAKTLKAVIGPQARKMQYAANEIGKWR